MPKVEQFSKFSALVSGSGSIGRRHMRNLTFLGVQNLAACDPDPDRLKPMVRELGIKPFADFEEALTQVNPDLVFVCTPPVLHLTQALKAVQADAHVFIEKPLSHSLDGIEGVLAEVSSRHRIVQVGYNLRFHPGLQKIKQLLGGGAIGQVLWAQAEFGQYLPDWRPWQDYRQSYTAQKSLGGGLILDGSHELDYISWLIGQPSEVMCMSSKVSSLEVDVPDCVTILMRFPSGAQADIHLDFVQRSYQRTCKLIGECGTIIWDYANNEVRLFQTKKNDWKTICYDFEPNMMYIDEVKDFLDRIKNQDFSLTSLEQARQTLSIALTAQLASETGMLRHAI